ncbi:restriction endonuclease subunit S [Maribacter polysiphoniae]|uniref:restriction endonuclease subunit S n=1 Tax=Maribacter polysiphoniae TaxID=429344 RepID=UPI002357F686|nr:restriction endonuclease subunit S [Maribacter polysiphoniae]
MPENWKTYKFEELYNIASGLSKSRDQFGFGHPFVTFKDVFYNWFLPEELGDLANTNEKEQKKGGIKKGDIILTRTSETLHELGMSSVALKDYPNSTFNGFCKRLRQKDESSIKIEPVFMAYFLRSRYFRNEVSKYATMTTRASLNIAAINSLSITLPPFDEQQEIASILKPLDDKIENNLAMNKTLEEMAMALYKHWFVDFGPFKDGKFIDSELGLIPEGWEVKELGEIYNTTSGGTPSRKKMEYYENGTIPWVKSKELYGNFIVQTEEKITELGLSKSSAKLVPEKTVMLAMYGATVGETSILSSKASCNQAICAIMQKEISYVYIFQFLRFFKNDILNQAVGSAQQNISQAIIKNLKIITPPSNLEVFDKIELLYSKAEKNLIENQTLTQLRDTLLPKLISGEVRLKEFEEKLTAVL